MSSLVTKALDFHFWGSPFPLGSPLCVLAGDPKESLSLYCPQGPLPGRENGVRGPHSCPRHSGDGDTCLWNTLEPGRVGSSAAMVVGGVSQGMVNNRGRG